MGLFLENNFIKTYFILVIQPIQNKNNNNAFKLQQQKKTRLDIND